MDRARRSTDASDEQEPKRPCLAGGHNGGAGGAGGSDAGGDGGDAGDDDSHSDAGGSGGDVGAGGGVGHAADGPRTLSTLGDDLLGAILSRLESSRQTVRMCMLSSRWRHLWRSVPSIHIDQREFGSDHEVQSFTDFLLDHHNNLVLLDAFRLLLSSEDLRLPACHWVRRVISQDDTPPYQLKRLHLCNVHLDKDFASHISDGRCPALEDVRLENCSYFTTRYKITSSSLKKLVVDGLHMVQDHYQGDDNDDDDDEILKLIIEAPALVSLRLAGELDHIVDTTEPHTMPALVDASVHLPMMTDEELNDIEENDATAYQSALGALFNVTSLNLSHFGLLFPDDSLELSVLENLRTLFLDECYVIGNDFVGLEPYLQKSPNLEKLTLRCSKVQPGYSLQWYFGREDPVDFMCENLMLTEIIYQHDDDVAHLLVKFLLSMSRSLPNNKIELIRVE